MRFEYLVALVILSMVVGVAVIGNSLTGHVAYYLPSDLSSSPSYTAEALPPIYSEEAVAPIVESSPTAAMSPQASSSGKTSESQPVSLSTPRRSQDVVYQPTRKPCDDCSMLVRQEFDQMMSDFLESGGVRKEVETFFKGCKVRNAAQKSPFFWTCEKECTSAGKMCAVGIEWQASEPQFVSCDSDNFARSCLCC
jgi:hypothetical protein